MSKNKFSIPHAYILRVKSCTNLLEVTSSEILSQLLYKYSENSDERMKCQLTYRAGRE